MDQQGKQSFPKAAAFEYVESEQAQKHREKDAENPRCPKENVLHVCVYGITLLNVNVSRRHILRRNPQSLRRQLERHARGRKPARSRTAQALPELVYTY